MPSSSVEQADVNSSKNAETQRRRDSTFLGYTPVIYVYVVYDVDIVRDIGVNMCSGGKASIAVSVTLRRSVCPAR